MFKKIRVTILLLILVVVATERWRAYHRTDWTMGLDVAVYPINGDNSQEAAAYIQTLQDADFDDIEEFFQEEAKRYGKGMFRPITLFLGPTVSELPPAPPGQGRSKLDIMLWSLKFRWWAWRHGDAPGLKPHVKLFLVYVDPTQREVVENSFALRESMAGTANLYGIRKQHKQNAVIIAHELLHTLGATDKYDPVGNYPRYPEGFAEPDANPRLPQQWAELMAGRTPVSADHATIPASLQKVLIGAKTAEEIGWLK
ncbi:hypothetical protein [Methylogaea oryzae]|uniref:Uncharacterized protein n=1 Tax=Methylogaea oryzae TaxID=1295382 RepID=A0A8D4VPQ3_9GAMM|nr:hypothetical protein [Methylogaea oryzae]BBL72158.1 hypothetical protein MoryE10_27640 [Methylogaea oryzae]